MEVLSAAGVPQDDIALCVRGGIAPKTLRKYFAEELRVGGIKANAQISAKLFSMAMSGNVASLIYWTKARMGWRESINNRVSFEDDEGETLDPIESVLEHLSNKLARRASARKDSGGSEGSA